MFRHVLVPTDGSELSGKAVGHAVSFAKDAGARITFYYAKQDFPLSLYGEGALVEPISPEAFAQMMDTKAKEVLDKALDQAKAAGVQAEATSTVSDSPYMGIIAAAKAGQCDLIFMASHGRRGLSGMLLGSETQKVLTHSSIPVLVYR